MKRLAPIGSGQRPALTRAARRARPTATRTPGERGAWLSAAGLLTLGLLGLGGCVADIPDSSPGQGAVALFNPAASPPVVPAPTDLVRVGGKLLIPVDPAEATNGALKTFNTYLRGLDGFPPDSTAETSFSAAIDSATLTDGVVVYDATDKVLLTAPDAVPALDPGGANKLLTISTKNRWRNGHTYFVGVLSWQDGGLRGTDAKPVIADTAFALLRSQTPLFAKCQDTTNAACACPDLTDLTCHAVVDGLKNAEAQQLEVARLGLKPIIDEVLAKKNRQRTDLVMGFSFTISKRSFATFDLNRGNIPFPSSLIMASKGMGDPLGDDLVKVPILPTDDARTQALKGGLNTLDGFSTTGSVQFLIDSAVSGGVPVDINAATVVPRMTAFLLNISVPTKQPAYTAAPLRAILDTTNNVSGFAGQVWLTPSSPLLGDRTHYAAVLTTNVKDSNGQPIVPSPVTLLITQSSPLVSVATADAPSVSLVPSIPTATAAQLEQLRLALVPLVNQFKALGIAPSTIAAVTEYRTQGIMKPMLQFIGATTQLAPLIPSIVSITSTTTVLPAPLSTTVGAVIHGTLTVRRAVDLRGPFNPANFGASTNFNEVIPFMLTLPIPALAPAGGAPVVIAQHGLTRWRGDTLAIAGTFAAKGMAMIAIDAIYHGGRVACVADADCAAGVTCNQQAGKCNGAYLAATGATPTLPGSPDLIPSATLPSRDFNNLSNPFAQRDNFRQHTLDLFQLVRVIKDTTSAQGLTSQLASNATLATLNVNKIGYFGQSLGSFLGNNFLAMTKDVTMGCAQRRRWRSGRHLHRPHLGAVGRRGDGARGGPGHAGVLLAEGKLPLDHGSGRAAQLRPLCA